MSTKKKAVSADPWAKLDAIMAGSREPMGPEWFTAQDYAKRYGFSTFKAHKDLARMTANGVTEMWKGCGGENKRLCLKFRVL